MTTEPRNLLAEQFQETGKQLRGLWVTLWGGGFAVVLLGFLIAWFFVEPAPPSTVVIAAGPVDGAYYEFAQQYGDYCSRHGVHLDVRVTAGSIENYQLLLNDPDVHLAIVQGGTAPPQVIDPPQLESIGSLYLEPVWIFYRGDDPVSEIGGLAGKRIAIGHRDSGTQAIARTMLTENGIDDSERTDLILMGGQLAAEQLREGAIDAAFFVVSQTAAVIKDLITAPGIRLLSLERHEAYSRRHQYLREVTLKQGVIDLEQNIPARDIHLVAPAANLVATSQLHDALVPLLLRAATLTHDAHHSLVSNEQFPSQEFVEFPLNESARLYFENGPPLLQKYLPFWVASAIDRGKVLLLPLVTLLIPLFKLAPPIYRWRIRSRIYRWYEVLRKIEGDLKSHETPEELEHHLQTLEVMERELDDVDSVPLSYMEEFYNLRLHVEFVDRRVKRERDARDSPEQSEQ